MNANRFHIQAPLNRLSDGRPRAEKSDLGYGVNAMRTRGDLYKLRRSAFFHADISTLAGLLLPRYLLDRTGIVER
jgi:hypothetical protein